MTMMIASKPPLVWTGNTGAGAGVRYGIAEVAQYITADGRRSRDIFLVWRQDGAAFRRRIGTAATLEAAKLLAEQDYAGRD